MNKISPGVPALGKASWLATACRRAAPAFSRPFGHGADRARTTPLAAHVGGREEILHGLRVRAQGWRRGERRRATAGYEIRLHSVRAPFSRGDRHPGSAATVAGRGGSKAA